MSSAAVNYQAGGNILPMTFVMANYPIDFQVIQANGTQTIIGISQMGTLNFPGGPGQQTLAAVSGGPIGVFQDEARDEPLLTVNVAITGGQQLCSASDGTGIPWISKSATQQFVGAEARESTLPGVAFPQNIRVRPRFYTTGTS